MENPTQEPTDLKIVKDLADQLTLDAERREYLSWRLCGFTSTEAAKKSGVGMTAVAKWLATDKDFFLLDQSKIYTLRKQASKEILETRRLRNTRAVLELDDKVLDKALEYGIARLGDAEAQYLKTIRSQYSNGSGLDTMLGLQEGEQMPRELNVVITQMRLEGNAPKQTYDPNEADEEAILEVEHKEGPELQSWETR